MINFKILEDQYLIYENYIHVGTIEYDIVDLYSNVGILPMSLEADIYDRYEDLSYINVCILRYIRIDFEFRRCGYGRSLLESFVSYIKEEFDINIVLYADAFNNIDNRFIDNEVLPKLYTSVGFVKYGNTSYWIKT